MKTVLTQCRRIVVKVGSSLVTNQGAGLDLDALGNWARQIAALAAGGHEVVLVSSGAIAEGMQRLGWRTRPASIHDLQAAAAVGQMGLVQAYESCFRKHDLHAAQVLLTHADLANRERYLNARTTLTTLLSLQVIPIINENDTVVTDEISATTTRRAGHQSDRCRRAHHPHRSKASTPTRAKIRATLSEAQAIYTTARWQARQTDRRRLITEAAAKARRRAAHNAASP
jgi:hypothetical protein